MTTLTERIASEMDAQRRRDLLQLQTRIAFTERWLAVQALALSKLYADRAAIELGTARMRQHACGNTIDLHA